MTVFRIASACLGVDNSGKLNVGQAAAIVRVNLFQLKHEIAQDLPGFADQGPLVGHPSVVAAVAGQEGIIEIKHGLASLLHHHVLEIGGGGGAGLRRGLVQEFSQGCLDVGAEVVVQPGAGGDQ